MGSDAKWYHESPDTITAPSTPLDAARPHESMAILRSPLLSASGFEHAFPERSVDDPSLRDALGVASIVQVRQVHGARCVEARDAADAPIEADAVVARRRAGGAPKSVGVRVADCVPLLLGDAATGDVAAIHAGWRGVVSGVLAAGVRALGDPASLVAAIGPSIGGCCFEVGEDVADAIARSCGDAPGVVLRDPTGRARPHVDLHAAVRAQLVALGLKSERIDDVTGCTKHEAERFHSFRRDGPSSGRMLAAIVTKPPG
jgi:YfiH family protein